MLPLESRLPEEAGYWDALADRLSADAAPALARNYEQHGTWWATLARVCPALATAAGLALVAGSITLATVPEAVGESPYAEVARAIEPTDQMARVFFSGAAPPSVESLMSLVARAEGDR